jgi:hypothetical protein
MTRHCPHCNGDPNGSHNPDCPIAKLKVEVTLVRYDETKAYNLDRFPAETAPKKVKSIHEVYLFDRNSQTYCCEITPSYWLEYLRSDVEWNEEPTEEERNAMEEELITINANADNSCYRHVRDVEAYVKANPTQAHIDKNEYDTMDEAIEQHDANHVF